MTFYDQDSDEQAPPEPDPPGLIASPWDVFALVGELGDDLSSVSPGQEDFLVGRAWAEALIAAVHGSPPDDESAGTLADQVTPRLVIDGREASDHGSDDDPIERAAATLAESLDVNGRASAGYREWPDYPCPDDPDGQHHTGCGCDF